MQFIQDPDAVLDYVLKWAAWLAGDTIDGATVIADDGIDVGSVTHDDTTVTVWLSGGTAGTTYRATCHIVTAGGREDDRSFTITVRDR